MRVVRCHKLFPPAVWLTTKGKISPALQKPRATLEGDPFQFLISGALHRRQSMLKHEFIAMARALLYVGRVQLASQLIARSSVKLTLTPTILRVDTPLVRHRAFASETTTNRSTGFFLVDGATCQFEQRQTRLQPRQLQRFRIDLGAAKTPWIHILLQANDRQFRRDQTCGPVLLCSPAPINSSREFHFAWQAGEDNLFAPCLEPSNHDDLSFRSGVIEVLRIQRRLSI